MIARSAGSECSYAGNIYLGEWMLIGNHKFGGDLRIAKNNTQRTYSDFWIDFTQAGNDDWLTWESSRYPQGKKRNTSIFFLKFGG